MHVNYSALDNDILLTLIHFLVRTEEESGGVSSITLTVAVLIGVAGLGWMLLTIVVVAVIYFKRRRSRKAAQ